MARGRSRLSKPAPDYTGSTKSSSSSHRPGLHPKFFGSETSSTSMPRYRPIEECLPPLKYPHEMMSDSESEFEDGERRYRGEPLPSVYGEDDYTDDGTEYGERSGGRGAHDPGFGLGPRDQFREDRSTKSQRSEMGDNWSSYHRRDQYDQPPTPRSELHPFRMYKDKLYRETYEGEYGYDGPSFSSSRSRHSNTHIGERGYDEYLDPSRKGFVRSPTSGYRHVRSKSYGDRSKRGKRGSVFPDGTGEVEVTLCSVM